MGEKVLPEPVSAVAGRKSSAYIIAHIHLPSDRLCASRVQALLLLIVTRPCEVGTVITCIFKDEEIDSQSSL